MPEEKQETWCVPDFELYSPDGRHVATWKNGSLTYHHADWLGTERMRTNSAGAEIEACSDTPYGMNLVCAGTDISPMHFTGKQLDSESNNTYFGARYYATNANLGRFMTPDWSSDGSPVPYAKLDNPQTLNLYAYLRNNPLNTVDPDGHGNLYDPFPYCILPGGEVSDLKHKNHPVNSVTILGQKVDVTYARGMSDKDQLAASGVITAAAIAINSNAGKLTGDEKSAIGKVTTINVVGEDKQLGWQPTNPGTINLSAGYLKASSPAWAGSILAHEGEHGLNNGRFKGANAWKDEKDASNMQMRVGMKLGFNSNEQSWLGCWSSYANEEDMEDHMTGGMTGEQSTSK